jgi:predicted phosphoribosyltransferase
MLRRFTDRRDAAAQLAKELRNYAARPNTVVIGLARGGVPVADTLAAALDLPSAAVVVCKLGVPGHRETAFGALAWFEGRVLRHINELFVRELLSRGFDQEALDHVEDVERLRLLDRAASYPEPEGRVEGKTVLLADDGLATGASMCAAVGALRTAAPAVVVAVSPVGSIDACRAVAGAADSLVCLHIPRDFGSVGAYYRNFGQVSDAEVLGLLRPSRHG